MNSPAEIAVATALATAQKGVDYSAKEGAVCPTCGAAHLRVVCTKPWDGDVRLRFHRCGNPDCLLSALKVPIKSLQTA